MKETHEKSYFSVYKISEKVLEKSVEWRRTELHDQWAKLLSGTNCLSVFDNCLSAYFYLNKTVKRHAGLYDMVMG